MPPPEVWGPATWQLFHTLVENIKEEAFPALGKQLFSKIVNICSALPCPECTADASTTLAKVRDHDVDTRKKLIDTIYLFHNYVNAKKNKPMFDYSLLSQYKTRNLFRALIQFQSTYHTRGNMKLMGDSLRRGTVLKDLQNWIKDHAAAFVVVGIPTLTQHAHSQPKHVHSVPQKTPPQSEPMELVMKEQQSHAEPMELVVTHEDEPTDVASEENVHLEMREIM